MKAVLEWKLHGKRPQSRPNQRWIDKVKNNLAEIGIQNKETLAQDRDRKGWKQICVEVIGFNG